MNNKLEVKLVANKALVLGEERYNTGDIISRHCTVRNALSARNDSGLSKDAIAIQFSPNSNAAAEYYGW